MKRRIPSPMVLISICILLVSCESAGLTSGQGVLISKKKTCAMEYLAIEQSGGDLQEAIEKYDSFIEKWIDYGYPQVKEAYEIKKELEKMAESMRIFRGMSLKNYLKRKGSEESMYATSQFPIVSNIFEHEEEELLAHLASDAVETYYNSSSFKYALEAYATGIIHDDFHIKEHSDWTIRNVSEEKMTTFYPKGACYFTASSYYVFTLKDNSSLFTTKDVIIRVEGKFGINETGDIVMAQSEHQYE